MSPNADEIRELEIDPAPYLSGVSHIEQLEHGVIPLSYPLLDDGLRVYSVADFDRVTLTSSQSKHSVQLSLTDFPYLAVWSPEHLRAPFVCVEPFKGLPDVAGRVGKLQDKAGGQSVLAGNVDIVRTKLTLCD